MLPAIQTTPFLFNKLIMQFKETMHSRKPGVITAMWNGSPLLKTWFCGQPVYFGKNESGDSDLRIIPLVDLIKYFKHAIAGRSKDISYEMWNENPSLRAWFSGQPANFSHNKHEQPDIRIASDKQLIQNFRSALGFRNASFIRAMWNDNERLHTTIRNLETSKSELLLNKVLQECSIRNPGFIRKYLKWLGNETIIRNVFNELKPRSDSAIVSRYKARQIDTLRIYLDETHDVSDASRDDDVSKKRSLSAEAKSSRNKKQKLKTSSDEEFIPILTIPGYEEYSHDVIYAEMEGGKSSSSDNYLVNIDSDPLAVDSPPAKSNTLSNNPPSRASSPHTFFRKNYPAQEDGLNFIPDDSFENCPNLPLPFDFI